MKYPLVICINMRLGIRQQQHQGESLVPSTETLLPEGTREGRQQSVSLFPSKRELERARRSRNQNNERTARRNSSGRRTHGNRELETRDDGSNELAPTRATSHVPSTKVRKDIHHATLSASTERALSTEREPVEKEIREFTLALDEQQFENPLTVIRATPKEKRKSIFTKVFKRTASGNDQHVGAMEEEVPAPSSAKTNRFSRFLPMFSRKQARALERTTERSQNKGCTMFLVENSSARKYQSERGLETHDDRSRIIAKDSLDRDLNKIGETPSPTRATTAVVSSYKKPDNSEDNAKALFSEIIQNGIAASLQSSKKNRALVSEREPAETKREKNNPTTPNEKVRYPSVVAELEALFAKRKISERDGLQKKSGKNTHSSPLLETKTTREAVKGSKVGKYKRKGKRNRTSRGKMSALELRALISKRSKKLGKNKNDENDKNAETLNQESSLKKDDSAIKLSSSKDEDDSIK